MHGRPVVMLLVCDSGPPDEAERRVAPIKAFGRPVADIVQRRPYVQQQRLIDATQPPGRRNYWKSEFLPGLSPDLLSRAIEHAARMASPHAVLLLFPVGGALNRLPGDHSAVGNRDAAFVLTIATAWERAEDDEANIGWARATWQDLRAFSTGGAYINFQTEDEGPARIRAAYRSNYGRLVEVKAKWDPENRFRVNKNIAPQ